MQHFTERKTFCFSKHQIKTMKKLKEKYHLDLQDFVREAIKEKIERERPGLIRKESVRVCPFSGREY